MKEVYDFLFAFHVYYLATNDNGQPRVRPFGTMDMFDGALYIQTGKSKDVAKQIEACSKVELCAFDGKQWIRVAADAIEDPRVEAQQHMLDEHPSLKDRYAAGDGNTVVYKLTNVTATFSSFTAEPKTVTF
ncbi:MAG: pyridoxamine 5'-phosphate oxidase family protein [Clostridia bacterium]|nr:pyridoxamine 5'-phosphate oxidase family protein [Clostridia bacterium]